MTTLKISMLRLCDLNYKKEKRILPLHDVLVQLNRPLSQTLGKKRVIKTLERTDVSRSKKDHFIGLSQASMFWFFFCAAPVIQYFLSAPRVTLLRKFFKTKRTQGLTNHLTRWVPHRFFRKKLRVYIILLIVFDMFRILTARLFVQKNVIAYIYRIENVYSIFIWRKRLAP